MSCALRSRSIAPHGTTLDRATVRQRKTGQPVRFESTEQTREAIDAYIKATPLIIYSVLAIAMVAAIALWVAV